MSDREVQVPNCVICGRERTAEDVSDYSPLQIITRQPVGWYSRDDGEICPECMIKGIMAATMRSRK